jgi:hypothetical protein
VESKNSPSGKSVAHRSLPAAIKLRCRIITVEGADQNILAQLTGVPVLRSHDVHNVWETKMKFALIGAAAMIGCGLRKPCTGTSRYLRSRLLRAVLPECKLLEPWPGQSL